MAEPFIGQVDVFGFNFVPESWGPCAGSLISISSNQALFSLLGTAYGGDGRTTFALPDLRGKVAISEGMYPGSQFDWKVGKQGGAETHTLNIQELAQHAHSAVFTPSEVTSTNVKVAATAENGDNATPSNDAFLAQTFPPSVGPDKAELIYKTDPSPGSTVNLGGVNVSGGGALHGDITVGNTGSNQKFSLLQTGLILNYCIAMKGLFPSRN